MHPEIGESRRPTATELESLQPIEHVGEVTDHDATMEEEPLRPALAPPAPALAAWWVPLWATLAAGGGWASSAVHPLVAGWVGLALGLGLGAVMRRFPGGVLLGASSWVIGGIAIGSVVTAQASRGAAAFADAGLIGAGLIALAAPAEPLERGAWWSWPARLLAGAGAVQMVLRWL